jgi:predicted RNA-binding protein YlxR (DUF448 family)
MLARTQQDALDAGPHKSGPGTARLCAVTRTVKPVGELIRFVVGPDGVVPDLKRKLPGRGLWITADKAALAEAVARNVFARGFKRAVRVPPALVELTERLLERAALDALAMAGKAGLVVTGFSRVEAALGGDKILALVHAGDAKPDGVSKLAAALRKRRADGQNVVVVTIFNSAQLGLAVGRPNVVHAALLAGPASDTFLARIERIERFRAGKSSESGRRGEQN